MKLSDYRSEQLKNEVREVLDFSHDTAFGGFFKGMEYERENWITDKMPEDFDDLKDMYGTKRVLCKCKKNPGDHETHVVLTRIQKKEGWTWGHPDNEHYPMENLEVLAWKEV